MERKLHCTSGGASTLLAGLYELPNCEGKKSQEEALAYVKEIGCKPIRIRELTEAKHIFSHVEWHMKGYTILIEEPEQPIGDLVFVESDGCKRTLCCAERIFCILECDKGKCRTRGIKSCKKGAVAPVDYLSAGVAAFFVL